MLAHALARPIAAWVDGAEVCGYSAVMNWRYVVGATLNRVNHAILSSPFFPLTRYVPPGRSWLYDIQRTNGTRSAGVIFDVGANSGQTAWGLVRYFPQAEIFCFEPVESSYEALVSAYARYPNLTCVRSALGSAVEQRPIYIGTNSELNTLLPMEKGASFTGEVERVDVTTIDAFCAARGIREIDILKLDVQGWELEVLKGCSLSPRYVFAEVGFQAADDSMQPFATFHAQMERAGYLFGGLYDSFRHGKAKQFVSFANALYIRQ